MRRRRSDSGMNLDSLLDTITNVVGFLVIVLAVLQLNVTWSPLPSPPSPPTPAPPGSRPSAAAGMGVRLEKLAMKIKDAENELAGRPSEAALDRDKRSLEDLLRKLEREIAELEKNVREAQTRLAGIGRAMDAVPAAPPPQPKVVISPRVVSTRTAAGSPPPWAKKKCAFFICRRGRVFPLNVGGDLGRHMDAALRSALGGQQAQSIADLEKLVAYFKTHDVGDPYFRLGLERMGTLMLLNLEPRNTRQGEAADQVAAGGTTYENVLRQHCDSKKSWVKFLVCADSFRVYLAARAKAEAAGLLVGWQPLENDFKFREAIGGGGGGGPTEGPDI